MDTRKVNRERRRLENLLELGDVPQAQRDALAPVIDNMAWQRIKLDEAREQMRDAAIVCHYDNGGGQTGERENPIFKAYINLWRAYLAGLEKLTAYLPKELQDEAAGDGLSILEQVRNMKRGSA